MAKIKNWRLALVAICVVFLACVLTVAFVNVPIGTANADGALEGTTASYDIINDTAHPWIYERATNTWYNNADKSYGLVKTLTVKVTSPGDIVFKYKANLYTSNKQGGTQYGFNNNDFYLELTKGKIVNTIVAKHGEKMADYEQLTVRGLEVNDTLVFKHKLGGSSTSDDDRVYVQGLAMPSATNVTITAIADGSGKISCEEDENTQVEKSVVAGLPVKLTAKADAGNIFAYWTDKNDTIISYDDTLSLTPLETTSYTARFVKSDIAKFSLDGWETTDNGYKLADASIAKKVSTLTYEFVGEKYFKFLFAHNLQNVDGNSNTFSTYLNDSLNVDVGGKLPSYTQYNNISGFDKTAPSFESCYIHVTGEGYHRFDFIYEMYTPYGKDPYFVNAPDDYLELKNFEVLDNLPIEETTEVELDYDQNYGTVYIDNKPTAPGNVTLPKGYKVMFNTSTVSSVKSKIDADQQVPVRWCGWYTENENVIRYANVNYTDGLIWPDPGNCGMTFSETGATGNNNFEMTGHKITAKMQEFAAAPQVSISPQIDGLVKPEYTLKNGERYEIDYGSSIGNVAVLMKDFENIKSTYHVKINDVARDDIQIAEEAGRKMFSLSNITADTKVTVYYSTDGYYDSAEFNFTIAIVYKGTLEKDILVEGANDITVENDEFLQWKFDAGLSGENGIAFVAGNSGSLGYYGKAVSSLKFTVQDAGVLDFDFKVYKNSCWLIYGDQPVSITDTVSGAGRQDDKGETVWWINTTEDSWNRIIARGSSSQKEVSNNNYMYWFQGTTYDGGKGYYMTDDGWAHVSIPVGEDSQTKDVYVSYYRNSDGYSNTIPYKDITECDYAAIRNVGFWKGKGAVNFEISNKDGGTVSATATEKLISGQNVSLGSRITFDVTVNQGYHFYGWVDQDNNLVSSKENFTCNLVGDDGLTLTAVVEPDGTYFLRERGAFFKTLTEGIDAVRESGGKLYVIKDGLTIDKSIEIPANVDIIFPIDDLGNYTAIGTAQTASNRVAWLESLASKKYKQFTITVKQDAVLTIKGGLYLGAVLHYPEQYAQGLTSGKYHQMVLDGSVVVESGGVFDVCGLVTGSGSITVNDGGKLYQPFMILDYSGGTNTQAMFGENLTPFKMYSMVNIQCTGGFRINYGGLLYGHASLFFWGGVTTIDQPFVTYEGASGEEETALIILKSDAYAEFKYDDKHARPEMGDSHNAQDVGKTTVTLNGDATAGYMSFPLGINTSVVYFSIPYNFELILEKGNFDIANPYKLMPGAIMHVKQGATLTINSGAGLHVYDSFEGPNVSRRAYPTATQLKAANYNSYASLIVDGKLIIQEGAEFLGTVQTTGTTGRIEIASGALLNSKNMFDGVSTAYSCNYTGYQLVAHVWDSVHSVMAPLQAGHNYDAVQCEQWTLPGITFNVETKTKHSGAHTTELRKTSDAELNGGSWKVEHSNHVYDWKPLESETVGANEYKELTRQCTEIGCSEKEHKYLFGNTTAMSATYKGSAFTDDDLKTIFMALYKLSANQLDDEGFAVAFAEHSELLNYQQDAYNLTVTLTNGAWLIEGAYKNEKTLTFKIDPFDLTENYEELQGREIAALTYNGQAQTPALTLKLGEYELKSGSGYDYTTQYTKNTDAGQASVTVTGEGNFTGSFTINFTINAATIDDTYSATVKDTFTYDGTEHKPTHNQFTFKGALKDYIKESDYTVSVENATNATTATATLTFKGNFSGTLTTQFEIVKKDVEITLITQEVTYNGAAQTPSSEATYWSFADDAICSQGNVKDDLKIKIGVSKEAKNAGEYDLTFSFENDNYNVTRKADDGAKFKINPKDIKGGALTVTGTYTYNGAAQTPSRAELTINNVDGFSNDQITASDVNITASKNTNAGDNTATVTVEGKGNFSGTLTATFSIAKASITVTIGNLSSAQGDTILTNYSYTVTSEVKFFGDDQNVFDNLREGYSCAATNEAKEGQTFPITMKFKEGTTEDTLKNGTAMPNYLITIVNGTYTITADIFKGVTFEGDDKVVYDGDGHMLAVKGADNIEKKTVTYTYQVGEQWNNVPEGGFKDAGTYTIKVVITVEYHDSTFEQQAILVINKKAITVNADNINAVYGDAEKALTWKVADSTPLAKGDSNSDLNITLARETGEDVNKDGYRIYATSKEAKNYDITVTEAKYFIAPKSIAGATVSVTKSYTYTGSAIVPVQGDISVTMDGWDKPITFTVASASSNVNVADSPVLTVTGTDNYEGTAEGTFHITPATVGSVTVQNTDSYVYNGMPIVPSLEVKSGTLTLSQNDYDIEFTSADSDHTNAGTVTFKVKGKGNFAGEANSSFTIIAKDVTVTLKQQTWATYNGGVQNAKSDEYVELKAGSALANNEELSALNITLTASGKDAKSYDITPSWNNKNYNVTFEYNDTSVAETENKAVGAFVIGKATITVTVKEASSTYGEDMAKLEIETTGICEGDNIDINSRIELSCEVGKTTHAGKYDIKCVEKAGASELTNYTIAIVNEVKYEVLKRNIKVNILDQNATFNIEGRYDFDETKWEIDKDSTLANDDTRETLAITLTRAQITKAGGYDITGTSGNQDYNVEFTNGTYTVDKLDISDLNTITLAIGEGSTQDENGVFIVKYKGEALTLFAMATDLQNKPLTLECYIGDEVVKSLNKEGTYDITLKIVDDNYTGSKTYKVMVTDANGFTEGIRGVLAELEELLGDKTADDITLDDFDLVCDIAEAIAKLNTEERELAESELEDYLDCIEAYNALTVVDEDVIITAKKLADAPIEWLYEAMAAASAIAVLAYIAMKGGRSL